MKYPQKWGLTKLFICCNFNLFQMKHFVVIKLLKMKTSYFFIIIISLLFINNCEHNNSSPFNCHGDEDIITVPVSQLEGLGFGIGTSTLVNPITCESVLDFKEKQFIIRSEDSYHKFQEYAECLFIDNWPVVDFEKHSLLAGNTNAPTISESMDQSVKYVCNDDKIIYYIKIKCSGLTAIEPIFYWTLIPKISSEIKVEFEIVFE